MDYDLSLEDSAAEAQFEADCDQDYYRRAEYDQEAQDDMDRA